VVNIGLVVVDLAEQMELLVLVVDRVVLMREVEMVVEEIQLRQSPMHSKIPVLVVVELVDMKHHSLEETVVPVSSSSHILHKYTQNFKVLNNKNNS
jgi:hypothetical protein